MAFIFIPQNVLVMKHLLRGGSITSSAEVLMAVDIHGAGHARYAVVQILLPVITDHLQPLEVRAANNIRSLYMILLKVF